MTTRLTACVLLCLSGILSGCGQDSESIIAVEELGREIEQLKSENARLQNELARAREDRAEQARNRLEKQLQFAELTDRTFLDQQEIERLESEVRTLSDKLADAERERNRLKADQVNRELVVTDDDPDIEREAALNIVDPAPVPFQITHHRYLGQHLIDGVLTEAGQLTVINHTGAPLDVYIGSSMVKSRYTIPGGPDGRTIYLRAARGSQCHVSSSGHRETFIW